MKNEKKASLEIPIDGKIVRGIAQKIPISKIELDPDNPRISMGIDSAKIGEGKKYFSQAEIIFMLRAQPSYQGLNNSIKHAGGATVSIWVYPINKDKYQVIEGNTRLLVHKDLSDGEDGEKYKAINCTVLPSTIKESDKDWLRLISHLHGHTDWDRYERAKYLYSLKVNDLYPLAKLEKVTKLSKTEILEDIEAYTIMDKQFRPKYLDNTFIHKFSYFKEFVKNKKLQYTMAEKKLDVADFCDWVGQRKIDRAMDVRKLDNVLKEPAALKIFLKQDLDRALDILKDLVPERSEKIYIIMADLTEKIGKIEWADIMEIKKKKSNKRKVIEALFSKLKGLLEDE